MKQPALGVAATALSMLLSLGFISLFDFPTFAGWVAYCLLCIIPMQIVIGITWGARAPGFAAKRAQPLKGMLFVLGTLIAGAVMGTIYFYVVGGGVSPPTPMLAQCTIVSVVVTFWLAIMWGGWPFSSLIKSRVGAGLLLLAASYLLNYILFQIFFNYGFLRGAAVYHPELDPGGMFNAWNALVFYLSAITVMFLMLHFDLWPLSKFPRLMKQPTLGLLWTAIALAVGGIIFWIATVVLQMETVAFMVRVPVPFIFGTIVVMNMLQGSLFQALEQPQKGVASAGTAVLVGATLAKMYGVLCPMITGPLPSGPPTYDQEIWLASALLSVTFPVLIFCAEFFQFWPLKKD